MRIAILGATRLFGRNFGEQLVAEGHEVTVLSRGRLPVPAGAQAIAVDRTDPAALAAAVANLKVDVVVDNVAYTAADVLGVLEAFRGRMRQYVFVSTISVYAGFDQGHIWHEDTMTLEALADRPEGLNPYAAGKRDAELALYRQEEVPFTILRPSIITGPDDYTRRLYFFIQRVLDGGDVLVPIEVPPVVHFTWHSDMARALRRVLLARDAYGRAYNIVGDDVFSYPRLVRELARAAGNEAKAVPVPPAWLSTLEGYELPFGDDGAVVLVNNGRQRDELGLVPTPAKEWLRELVEFHRGASEIEDSAGYGQRAQERELLAEAGRRYAAFDAPL